VRHYDLLLSPPDPGDTHRYETMITSKRADGIIFLGQGPGDQWLKKLARTRVPFVVWGAGDERATYCTVGSDNRRGGLLAGERFRELGRRRILFVGNRSHPEMEQRRQGLQAAMDSAGYSVEIEDLEIPDFTFETGYAAVSAHLERDAFEPDAIFAGS